MKAKSTINDIQFSALTEHQQSAELKKMAKRANVRASQLEEKGIINQNYLEASDFNFSKGKIKNRFSEGTKYTDATDIKNTYEALTNFLNDESSTLGGIEKAIQQKVQQMTDNGTFNAQKFKGLSQQEQQYASKAVSKIANKQLKTLEDEGLTKFAYKVAQHDIGGEEKEKKRFYAGTNFEKEKDIKKHMEKVSTFINSKTATPQGYKQIADDRINAFRAKGINIPIGKEEEFYAFLSSEAFKVLGAYADSNQVLETYVDARNAGEDANTINFAFLDFLNEEITFDEVQERLNVAKWNKGGLLH